MLVAECRIQKTTSPASNVFLGKYEVAPPLPDCYFRSYPDCRFAEDPSLIASFVSRAVVVENKGHSVRML